jgi:hypothetical protein
MEEQMDCKEYDSRPDTLAHIQQVREFMFQMMFALSDRAKHHDKSKLEDPEKVHFDRETPLLKRLTYGTDEYYAALVRLKPALDHHYGASSHHPEHYPEGIEGMSLLDLAEMFCDWKAASMRHEDGDFGDSLKKSGERFKVSGQLQRIFKNTQREMNW